MPQWKEMPVCAVTVDAAGTLFFDGIETPPELLPRRLYRSDVGKAGILLTLITGISDRVVRQQLYLLRNDLHLMAKELLANGLHLSSALPAGQLFFRQFQKHFLLNQSHHCSSLVIIV